MGKRFSEKSGRTNRIGTPAENACHGRERLAVGRERGPAVMPGSRMNRRTSYRLQLEPSRRVGPRLRAACRHCLPGRARGQAARGIGQHRLQARPGCRGAPRLRYRLRPLPEGVQQGSQRCAFQDRAGAHSRDGLIGAPQQGPQAAAGGDVQGALAEFLHAAEIDPGNEAAQQEIARVRQKQGAGAPAPRSACPSRLARSRSLRRWRPRSN